MTTASQRDRDFAQARMKVLVTELQQLAVDFGRFIELYGDTFTGADAANALSIDDALLVALGASLVLPAHLQPASLPDPREV